MGILFIQRLQIIITSAMHRLVHIHKHTPNPHTHTTTTHTTYSHTHSYTHIHNHKHTHSHLCILTSHTQAPPYSHKPTHIPTHNTHPHTYPHTTHIQHTHTYAFPHHTHTLQHTRTNQHTYPHTTHNSHKPTVSQMWKITVTDLFSLSIASRNIFLFILITLPNFGLFISVVRILQMLK